MMGPFGSGKSVAMCMEVWQRACRQTPFNGVRRSRWGVIRQTYRKLESTTLKTFMEWLGPYGTLTKGSPITFRSNITLPDRTQLDLEVLFFPLSTAEDVEQLKSLELTGVWINEASELQLDYTTDLKGRIKRFPSDRMGGPSWSGIIMDTNPPSNDHWFFKLFEEDRPPGHKLYRQPGALMRTPQGLYVPNPDAENIRKGTGGFQYYIDMLYGAPENKIRTNILGEYASSFEGVPVYSAYNDLTHAAIEVVKPSPAIPVVIGMDFGLNPAAVFTQVTPSGAVLAFDELSPEPIPFEEFLEEHFMPKLRGEYAGFSAYVVGDPTGQSRNAMSLQNVYQMLTERGVACGPALTNNIELRKDSVSHFLLRRNGFILNPALQVLRDGFLGGYRYEQKSGRRQKAGASNLKATPEKGRYSHIHDALQYACLYHYRGGTKAGAGAGVSNVRTVRRAGTPRQGRFVWA
jgi:hypothetical protein